MVFICLAKLNYIPDLTFFPSSPVGQGKQKSPKNSYLQTRTSKEVQAETKTEELTQYKKKCENQSGIIQQLKKCLSNSNRKLEALALVIQHFQSEVKFHVKHIHALFIEISIQEKNSKLNEKSK